MNGSGTPDEGKQGESPLSGEDESVSSEFAQMLAAFERTREMETPEIGQKVRGRLIQLGEEICFIDFGGRSEGAVETRHFRDEDGNLTVQFGEELDLFVVENRDQVLLAPVMRAEPAVALSQVQEARRSGMPVSGPRDGT